MWPLDADGIIWAVVISVLVIGYGVVWIVFRKIARK